ncbi:GntR family transcriptional regulator [Frigidibacter sp. MR17.24]|uniref:GntR family transcriptional regulator n=1 Tax=Frigidibacter sp. MR17.24 TaxID=3127345 RepID=UPI003012A313
MVMADPLAPGRGAGRDGNLVDLAYERIEELIVLMQMAPGARVVEHALVERLDIGRTPVREALLRLAADGLLVPAARRGLQVCDLDFGLQFRVLEARRALECVLVPAAARRRSPEEACEMRALVASFRALSGSARSDELLRLDGRFVRLLLRLSGNPFLARILPLYSLSRRFWLAHRDLYLRQFRDETLTEFHIRIGEAVAEGDEAAARAETEAFLTCVEAYTTYLGRELAGRERT